MQAVNDGYIVSLCTVYVQAVDGSTVSLYTVYVQAVSEDLQ